MPFDLLVQSQTKFSNVKKDVKKKYGFMLDQNMGDHVSPFIFQVFISFAYKIFDPFCKMQYFVLCEQDCFWRGSLNLFWLFLHLKMNFNSIFVQNKRKQMFELVLLLKSVICVRNRLD